MTGPEHYKKAEDLLKLASETALGSDMERFDLAAAQVHATLALAAATALSARMGETKQWDDVFAPQGGKR